MMIALGVCSDLSNEVFNKKCMCPIGAEMFAVARIGT